MITKQSHQGYAGWPELVKFFFFRYSRVLGRAFKQGAWAWYLSQSHQQTHKHCSAVTLPQRTRHDKRREPACNLEQKHMERTAGGSADATVLGQDNSMPAGADEGLMLYNNTLGHTAGNPADSIGPDESLSMSVETVRSATEVQLFH